VPMLVRRHYGNDADLAAPAAGRDELKDCMGCSTTRSMTPSLFSFNGAETSLSAHSLQKMIDALIVGRRRAPKHRHPAEKTRRLVPGLRTPESAPPTK